jgi:hypothetical protein
MGGLNIHPTRALILVKPMALHTHKWEPTFVLTDLHCFYHIFEIYYGIQNGLPKALFKIQLYQLYSYLFGNIVTKKEV